MSEYEEESIEVSEEIEISEEAVEPKKKKKKREKREYHDETYGDHSKVLELLSSAQGADNDMRDQARDAQLFVSKKDGQGGPYWW